ncbi:VOC family protein [Saliphagus sp. GCM10025334]
MARLQRIEHARMGVTNLESAVDFYTGAMGLVELTREDDIVYLGCGRDNNYDIAVVEGGSGVEHFAVRASDATVVDEYEEELNDAGFDPIRTDGDEPGQETGVRFDLSSGFSMEIVTVADGAYQHFENPPHARSGQAPADIDHIQFLTPTLNEDLGFLRDVLDFKISDTAGDRENPELAFARSNTFHHDIALKSAAMLGEDGEASLHHLAWSFDSMDHLKQFIDRVVGAGCEIERGIGRHHAGNNIYAYFWEPGGNRFELCTEMAVVMTDEPNHSDDYESATTAWGPDPPASFSKGSGLFNLK